MYVSDDQGIEYIMDEHEIEKYEQNKPLKRRAAFKKYMGSIKKKSNRPPSDILKLAMEETKDKLGQGLLQLEEVGLDDKDLPEYFDDYEEIPGILTVTRESSSYSLTDHSDISVSDASPRKNLPQTEISNSSHSLNMNETRTNSQPRMPLKTQWSSEPKLQITNDSIHKQTDQENSPQIKFLPQNPSLNFNSNTERKSKTPQTEIKPANKNANSKPKKEENKQKNKAAKAGSKPGAPAFSKDDLKHFKQFEKDFFRIMEHDDEKQWKSVILPPKSPKPASSQPTKGTETQQPDKKSEISAETIHVIEEDSLGHRQKPNLSKINPKNYFSTLPYRKSKRKKKSIDVFENSAKDDQEVSVSEKKSDSNSPQKHFILPKSGNLGQNTDSTLRPSSKTIENDLLMQIFDQEKEQNWKVVVLTQEQKDKMKEKRMNKLKNIENQKRKEEEEKRKREEEALAIKMIEEAEAKTQESKSNDTIELTVKGAYVIPTENDTSSDDLSSSRSSKPLQNMAQRFSSLRRAKSSKTMLSDKSPSKLGNMKATDKHSKNFSTFSLDRGKAKVTRTESLHYTIESYKQKLLVSKRPHRSTPSTDNNNDSNKAKIVNKGSTSVRPVRQTSEDNLAKPTERRAKNVNESGKLLLQKAASLVTFKSLKDYQKRKSPGGSKLSLSSLENVNATDEFWWNMSTSSLADDQLNR